MKARHVTAHRGGSIPAEPGFNRPLIKPFLAAVKRALRESDKSTSTPVGSLTTHFHAPEASPVKGSGVKLQGNRKRK